MICPLQSEENLDILLDFSVGRLDGETTAELARHMDTCAACAAYRNEQAALWLALDEWQPEPVGMGFNRKVWQRIEAAAAAPWYRRLADGLRFGAWKPAFPLAAALLAVAAGFMFDHQRTLSTLPGGANDANVSLRAVTVADVEKLETALEDMQLLRQFENGSPQEAAGSHPL